MFILDNDFMFRLHVQNAYPLDCTIIIIFLFYYKLLHVYSYLFILNNYKLQRIKEFLAKNIIK